ncbi:Cyclin-dependent kinase 2-associated protein 1 [Sciurus carolinensis]|uniref:Cyclin-dependent kinase 2-associated protein 1 n=4 Tax=Boreoeutheria TaxID=1437010 RepID=A0AA41MVA6_SCICA|nr:Cyclin-dependent kinase 2-associated protein 1 [Sciurus carolinensis]
MWALSALRTGSRAFSLNGLSRRPGVRKPYKDRLRCQDILYPLMATRTPLWVRMFQYRPPHPTSGSRHPYLSWARDCTWSPTAGYRQRAQVLHSVAGSIHPPSTSMAASSQYRQLLSDYGPPSLGYTQGTGNSQVPQSKYAELLAIIEELGKEIRPTYAGSKSAMERLKRGIIHARGLVRECLAETERNARS